MNTKKNVLTVPKQPTRFTEVEEIRSKDHLLTFDTTNRSEEMSSPESTFRKLIK